MNSILLISSFNTVYFIYFYVHKEHQVRFHLRVNLVRVFHYVEYFIYDYEHI